jgi:hypothetical protein
MERKFLLENLMGNLLILTEARHFALCQNIQTGPRALPASYSMETRVLSCR